MKKKGTKVRGPELPKSPVRALLRPLLGQPSPSSKVSWISGSWRVEKRWMNESSRFSDDELAPRRWADADAADAMTPVSCTVVRSFSQRWLLLVLPSQTGRSAPPTAHRLAAVGVPSSSSVGPVTLLKCHAHPKRATPPPPTPVTANAKNEPTGAHIHQRNAFEVSISWPY